ncbi:protein FMC1 homolog [Liolophura sinensis]|uniref:protein FMC1 homolog n=1 Tax=Liolophura sinensis TaxID=3198878 RepID=UPI0031583C84
MAARESGVVLYKTLLKELRRVHPKNAEESAAYSFVKDQFRKFQVTGEKTCRASNEVQHVAETYICFLQSARKFEELNMQYKGKGEATVEDSAHRVGLAVPGDIPDCEK